ncbi:hypothetical protein AWV79_32100 [Cupriavidus sp. UYMMa02A]|nr:hypothetical protein AWV79_32100 [Cupriavidus sp. UYMMa02A]
MAGAARTFQDRLEEIRAAYRRLAMKFHPDRQQHGKSALEKKQAEEKFKEIEKANRIPGDAQKRAEYDLGQGNGATRSGNPGWAGPDEADSNFEDFFRQQFHKSHQIRRQSRPPPVRGEDIHRSTLTLRSAVARQASRSKSKTRAHIAGAQVKRTRP